MLPESTPRDRVRPELEYGGDLLYEEDRWVDAVLEAVGKRSYEDIKAEHIREHHPLFRRAAIRLPAGPTSYLPTDERLAALEGAKDPALAALCFQSFK